MALGVWVFLGWMFLMTVSGILFLIWAWGSGQFRNVEEAKYHMLEDREPEPWPEKPQKSLFSRSRDRKKGDQP